MNRESLIILIARLVRAADDKRASDPPASRPADRPAVRWIEHQVKDALDDVRFCLQRLEGPPSFWRD
jgi:hypothetical protein